MAAKNRPGSAKDVLRQQEASLRREAPGKRFIGETARQREEARRAERDRVERMAEIEAAEKREAEAAAPMRAILAELAEDFAGLVRSVVAAPFRIAMAMRRPKTPVRWSRTR
jgi:hypothetical protein